ncbi:MAG: hypothetical protein KAU22_12900, partial [Desulfuromonadales bacterium]|nr:hypothetical protein [Desulfuromonadales bacterium]
KGLKIPREQSCTSSILVSGTIIKIGSWLLGCWDYFFIDRKIAAKQLLQWRKAIDIDSPSMIF